MGITAINGIEITASLASSASITNTALSASTVLTTTNADHFLVFVDSNNLSPTSERLGTVATIRHNPGTGLFFAQTISSSALTASSGINAGTASLIGSASEARVSQTASRAQNIEVLQVPFGSTVFPTFTSTNPSTATPAALYNDNGFTFNTTTNEITAGVYTLTTSSNFSNTTDGNLQFSAAATQSMYWVASFTATRSLIIDNIAQGRQVRVYIRNTNATQRQIIFSGSTTTSGHAPINMAVSAGGSSTTTPNIAATNGTLYAVIENIGGNIVGGIM